MPNRPSSPSSPAWPRDNLISTQPAELYDGRIHTLVPQRSLPVIFDALQKELGLFIPTQILPGAYAWRVHCESESGPFTLEIPLAVDEAGQRGRRRVDVPRRNVENVRRLTAGGLKRFLQPSRALVAVSGRLPVAVLAPTTEHHALRFTRGRLHVLAQHSGQTWEVPLSLATTAELLTEMVAALAYHYEPEVDGGTAIADVFVNDGDFAVRRRRNGSFDLRLLAARYLEQDIRPALFLCYLIQWAAYDPWKIEGQLVGIPAPMSNPSIAFEGLVRGRRYRSADLGSSEERGSEEARRWIAELWRSPHGRAYRPWAEQFLRGDLPVSFGDDLREHWWQLAPLRQRKDLLALRARYGMAEDTLRAELEAFLERLSREIVRTRSDARSGTCNDLGRDEVGSVFRNVGAVPSQVDHLVDEWMDAWPYVTGEHLLVRVPALSRFPRFAQQLTFGRAVPESAMGTLESLPPSSDERATTSASSNAEIYGDVVIPESGYGTAADRLPSFATYMDAVLHDPAWGYYAHHVEIGTRGHFNTHPEILSPHYGRWLATLAFRTWRDLIAQGDTSERDCFHVVELGAGNGRLARDILDSVAHAARDADREEKAQWARFEQCLSYCIYEMSESLRQKQAKLLGDAALVRPGDARRPADTLREHHPHGVVGMVLSNEVPDTFGVHKVWFSRDGARAALVLPRVEAALLPLLADALAARVEAVNVELRAALALGDHLADYYLDASTWLTLMQSLPVSSEAREQQLSMLWFEEAYVPVSMLPELAEHLESSSEQYALALAAGDSDVVGYVGLHACRFVRELAAAMRAGIVLTVDYGDSTWGLFEGARRGDSRLRVYGETSRSFVPRTNDPYTEPGAQDITTDVNFTDLAHAGEAAGLCVVHYGAQIDLAREDLTEILRGADREPYSALLEPDIKVLVLGTRAMNLLTPVGATHRLRRERGGA